MADTNESTIIAKVMAEHRFAMVSTRYFIIMTLSQDITFYGKNKKLKMPIHFQKSKLNNKPAIKRRITGSLLATIGYILSPLSWWNDMVVNIPLAYAFSLPFSLISEKLFLPTLILGYWLSNLLGLMMLHRGVAGLISKTVKKTTLQSHIIITFLYTAVIIIFVWLQWIPLPIELIRLEK